jgi:hypothetical protein
VVGGLVLLVVAALSRRRGASARRVLPRVVLDAVAGACFGLGAIGLGALSVDQAVHHGAHGVGFFLSGALVALAAAAFFAVRATRTLMVTPRPVR